MKRVLLFMLCAVTAAGLLAGCSKNSSGGFFLIGTSAGTGTINMKGGASNATGGNGGWSYIETYQVQGVTISRSGSADAGFSMTNYNPPTDLGANGVTISSNTTVPVLQEGDVDPGAGNLYIVADFDRLYKGSGAGNVPNAPDIVTGLKVDSGATLTLGLNKDSDVNGSYDAAKVVFASDVDIAGKVATADLTTSISTVETRHSSPATARDKGALYLWSDTQMFIRSNGSIDTKGSNGAAASERGGDGGYIYLYAGNYFANNGTIDASGGDGFDLSATSTTIGGDAAVSGASGGGLHNVLGVDDGGGLWGKWVEIDVMGGTGPSFGLSGSGGVLVNSGNITLNGGKGSDGGGSAEVFFYSHSDMFNTGSITANGGTGVNGDGQSVSGWRIDMTSRYGSINNSGTVSNMGGDGTTGGGSGGQVRLHAGYDYVPFVGPTAFSGGTIGDIRNTGTFMFNGGNASVSGSGGSVAGLYLNAFGAIMTSGNISLNGGSGVAAGGTGGNLYVQNAIPTDSHTGNDLAVRDIQVSGNLSMNGGMAETGTGGAGGTLQVFQPGSSGQVASIAGVKFLGYASADLSGGDGVTGGGDATWGSPGSWSMEISVNNSGSSVGAGSPEGPIVNEIPITIRGGNVTGTAGGGGDAGGIYFHGNDTIFGPGDISVIDNSGTLDVSGGAGGSSTGSGGNSGEIDFYAHDGVKNSADLLLKGGDSVGGTGGDGVYDGLYIESEMDIVNSGTINTTGGKGVTGGNGSWWFGGTPFGDWIQMRAGGQVTNSGSIISTGGAGTTTNGNGGGIDLQSQSTGTVNTGSLNVDAGGGAGTAGQKGEAWIDWAQVL